MDKVVVAVGDVTVAEASLPLVGAGGAINFFAGLPSGAVVPVDLRRLHYEEVHITGTSGFAPADFAWAVEAMGAGRLNLDGVVTQEVVLEGLDQAFQEAGGFQGIKTVAVFPAEQGAPAARAGGTR